MKPFKSASYFIAFACNAKSFAVVKLSFSLLQIWKDWQNLFRYFLFSIAALVGCAHYRTYQYWMANSYVSVLKFRVLEHVYHVLKINESRFISLFVVRRCRGGSRTAATSKVELFVIIVNG